MILANFNIVANTPISTLFLEKDISTFYDAIQMVHDLPYGRIKDRLDLTQVLIEEKGTCSTKHALLKALTEEHSFYGLELVLAIYAMDDTNTPGVGKVLKKYNLPYMFEAHVYLTYDEESYDYTFPGVQETVWNDSVIIRTTIDTDQIGDYKEEFHKSVLEDWILRDHLDFTVDQLWKIREECITSLDQTTHHNGPNPITQ